MLRAYNWLFAICPPIDNDQKADLYNYYFYTQMQPAIVQQYHEFKLSVEIKSG